MADQNRPIISIIVPVYQVVDYLERCLTRILEDKSAKIEVIVVDDGSIDGSGLICDEFARQDSRVIVVHQKNSGVSVARNMGMDIARGRWIWFIDSDDAPVSGVIPKLINIAETSQADTIICGMRDFYPDGSTAVLSWGKSDNEAKGDLLYKTLVFTNVVILFSNSIIQEYHIRQIPGVKIAEDLEFQYRYLFHCESPVIDDIIIYDCFIREGSASRNENSKIQQAKDSVYVLQLLLSYFSGSSLSENLWLKPRLTNLVKSGMNAAMLTCRAQRRELLRDYSALIKQYRNTQFQPIFDRTIIRALKFPYLYSRLLKCRIRNHDKNLCN